jgi:hypothetical protein
METLDYIYDPGILKVLGRDNPVSLAEIESIVRKREIVYFKLADLSYNQIIEYFRSIRGLWITKYYIASVIREAGARAKFLNGIYDAKVASRIRIIEIDEVFQGKLNCYLGVVDKNSHYLLVFARLADRSIPSFKMVLEPLVDDLKMLELIITDALAAYKSVIPGVFEGILHVLCHVHACRVIMKEGNAINRKAQKVVTTLQETRKDLVKKKNDRRTKKRRLKRLERRFAKIMATRDAFNVAHGIKPYSKTKKFATERKWFNEHLGNIRPCIKSVKKTISTLDKKICQKELTICTLEKDAAENKQESMQSGRLVAGFRRLLDCPADAFEAELGRYMARLGRSKYSIAKKIKKFIKNNPSVYATNLPKAKANCPLNLINTNTAEGTFSIARPVLNKAKHFFNSEQSEALLEIFRLKHNMSAPFTGPNNHWSPLERAGVHSSFSSFLDAIFPLPGERERHNADQKIAWTGIDPPPVPSEDQFRENLVMFKLVSKNLAERSPIIVKNDKFQKK